MENQVRELLRDIAEDIPLQREMPPTLRPRARRRIAATVGVTVVVVGALALGGVVAVRSITESSPRPAHRPNNVQLPNAPEDWLRIVLPDSDRCPADNCHVDLVAAGDTGLVVATYTELPSVTTKFVGWSSPDGVSWHPIEGDVWQRLPGAPRHGVEGVAAAGPGFVAVGREGVWASTDGVSWDLVHPSPEPGDWVQGVTAGGPGVVAVGGANQAWYSSDGLTWEEAEVPPGSADMTDVAAGADRLVATGDAIWVSSDGTSWRDVPIDGDLIPRGCNTSDVAGTPNGFVAGVGCGFGSGEDFFLHSPDGEHWERVGGDAFDGEAPEVAAGPGGWFAVEGDAAWTSVDGESWTRVPTGPTFQGATTRDVTAWGSRFVVVGNTDDGRNVVWISGPQQ